MWKLSYANVSANDLVNLGPEGCALIRKAMEQVRLMEELPGGPPPGYELPFWLFVFGPYAVSALVDHEAMTIAVLAVGPLERRNIKQ